MVKVMGLVLIFFLSSLTAWPKVNQDTLKTYEDIRQTFGSIPIFLKDYPSPGISGVWEDMKGIELNPNSSIPRKYKELIGLAVAAQLPCRYCVYFHTKASELYKATPNDIKEALAMASTVGRWSTILNGSQVRMSEFKDEVDKLFVFASKNKNNKKMDNLSLSKKQIHTPQAAYQDMEKELGFIPFFLKNYPQNGIVGVWKEVSGVEMNPQGEIPDKYKHLIGLAVAAQIPCHYSVYFHTQSAIFKGASKEELTEAVAMAGITSVWSTIFNGMGRDENKFKAEIDKIMRFLIARPPNSKND